MFHLLPKTLFITLIMISGGAFGDQPEYRSTVTPIEIESLTCFSDKQSFAVVVRKNNVYLHSKQNVEQFAVSIATSHSQYKQPHSYKIVFDKYSLSISSFSTSTALISNKEFRIRRGRLDSEQDLTGIDVNCFFGKQ